MISPAKESVQSDLEPYVTRLTGCVIDAIREYQEEQAAARHKMRLVTEANLLRDYIVNRIKTEFPHGEDGITHHEKGGLFLLNIKNCYYLRVKKFNRKHRTSNSPTQLSLDFLWQVPLTLFPELPEAPHLNIGYRPGITLAESTVWITCPAGHSNDWTWELTETAEPVQLEIPLSAPAARKPLARPKTTTIQAEQDHAPHS
jgi:hypothetical protein